MRVVNGDMVAPSTEKKDRKVGYRLGFSVIGVLILLMALTLPVAAFNLLEHVRHPISDRFYYLIDSSDQYSDTTSVLNIEAIALDEVQQLLTLRVSGSHFCDKDCTYKEKFTFFSIGAAGAGLAGLPPSESFTLPATSAEFNTKFQLPISTNLIAYPFDHTELTLGVTLERIAPDNTVTRVPDDEARKELIATIQERITRTEMDAPHRIDPTSVRPLAVKNFDYLLVEDLHLYRPAYLRVLVTLVVLLTATAAAYAAFLRPFDQLIINAGALVLGVYGIRSLVLGSLPNDVTALDIFLTCVAFFLLATIAVRGFNYLHFKSGWRIPGLMTEKPATTRTCPYCKTDVDREATRCPHCTSPLEPDAKASEPSVTASPVESEPLIPVGTPSATPPGIPWQPPHASTFASNANDPAGLPRR